MFPITLNIHAKFCRHKTEYFIAGTNVEGHTTNKLDQMFLMDFEIEKVTGEIWRARGNAQTLLVSD